MPVISIFVSLAVFSALFLSVIFAMTRLVLRYIYIIVPSVFDKIDRAAAGIIFCAMLAPLLLVTWRDVHIDRLINNTSRSGLNHDGPCINDFWLRVVPDVNTSVKAGLADTDRNTDIGGLCGNGNKDDQEGKQ